MIDTKELRRLLEEDGKNNIDLDEIHELLDRLEAAEKERDDLRAKIEAMEKQEPVAWTTKLALRHGANALGFDACAGNLWGEKGVPLYALPGAHPKPDCGEAGHDEGRCGNMQCLPGAKTAPSVPKGWKLVPIVSTAEMDNAGADHCDGHWDTAQAVWDAMLAAAPEAKP